MKEGQPRVNPLTLSRYRNHRNTWSKLIYFENNENYDKIKEKFCDIYNVFYKKKEKQLAQTDTTFQQKLFKRKKTENSDELNHYWNTGIFKIRRTNN